MTAPKDVRAMTDDQLAEEARKSNEELLNLRFQHATGELENTSRVSLVKKEVARIHTIARERGLVFKQLSRKS